VPSHLKGIAVGYSMAPWISPGDTLSIEKVLFADLWIGDIVVFYQKKTFISHRVILKRAHTLLLKGDNEAHFDPVLGRQAIVGRVCIVEGQYGRIKLCTAKVRVIAVYFILYSLLIYLLPFKNFTRNRYPGKRFLLRLLANRS